MPGLLCLGNKNLITAVVLIGAGISCTCGCTCIDWEAEIAATDELSRNEFEEHEISQLVRDSYTEDFVRIMPHSVIQGDFKELENNILAWREMGHVRMGTDHVMWTLDDSAMAWRHMTVYNETKSVCMIRTNFYVLDGGRAKIKMQHLALKSTT